jgi:hypothetical protein
VQFTNGGVPSIVSSLDLNNPSTYVWAGGRVNIQNELRETRTKGAHADLTWGDKSFNIKGGLAYDDINRRIRGQDNSAAWQAAVCGNNPSVFLMGPNGAPNCDGASTPGASAAGLRHGRHGWPHGHADVRRFADPGRRAGQLHRARPVRQAGD